MGKFFRYRQNNSGGRFYINDAVNVHVIIEAEDVAEANSKAEDIGLYFDGAGDCPCCGPRWYELDEDEEGYDVPSVYELPLEGLGSPVRLGNHNIVVHYANGTRRYFSLPKFEWS